MKLEVMVVPVRDVEKAKDFYADSDPRATSQARCGASVAHGEHERRIGAADANRPAWYAEYMVAEQAGTELPT